MYRIHRTYNKPRGRAMQRRVQVGHICPLLISDHPPLTSPITRGAFSTPHCQLHADRFVLCYFLNSPLERKKNTVCYVPELASLRFVGNPIRRKRIDLSSASDCTAPLRDIAHSRRPHPHLFRLDPRLTPDAGLVAQPAKSGYTKALQGS
jgi:hypothetical protein